MTGHLSDIALQQMIDVAEEGMKSGEVVTQGLRTGRVETEHFQIQPFLFGDRPEGRRFLVEVDVFDPQVGRKVRMTLELGVEEDLIRLQEIAAEELRRRAKESPPAFNNVNPDDIQAASVVVTFAERRF